MASMNELIKNSMRFAQESNEWATLEGERLVLAMQWKMKYSVASPFWKKVMLWTTPKSLFIPIEPPSL